MEFRLLGPLEVVESGVALRLRGRHERALLTLLLLHAGEVVPRERLIELLWQRQPPRGANHSLQTYVSRLRKAIGTDGVAIEFQPTGYRLRLRSEQLDLRQFEQLVDEGWQLLAARDPQSAEERLTAALALWRGPPLPELADDVEGEIEAARLDELRLSAIEAQIDAQLDLGHDGDMVGRLQGLVAAYPLRETLQRQLMLALYRSGRQAEALDTYQHARRELVDHLGIEPSSQLSDLQQGILRHDSSLEPTPASRGSEPRRILLAGLAALLVVSAAALMAVVLRRDRAAPVVVPDSLVKIDAATRKIVSVYPVGESTGPVAFAGRYMFIVGSDKGTLFRFDTHSGAFTASNRYEASGAGLAVEHDRWIWISNTGASNAGHAYLTRLLSDPLIYSDRIDLPRSAKPVGIAVGGGSLWVAEDSPTAPAVSRWNLRTLQRERRYNFPAAEYPAGITFGGSAAWIAVPAKQELLRIDAGTGAMTPVRLGRSPRSSTLAYGSLWVHGYHDPAVWRIDPDTGALEVIRVPATPQGLAAGAGSIWVTDCSGGLSRIDPDTNAVVDTIKTGYYPRAPAYRDRFVWVPVADTDKAVGLCETRDAQASTG